MHIAWTSQAFRSRALVLALAMLPCAGCQTPTGTGMAAGAGIGALFGSLLGGCHPVAGALAGAAVGTAAGGIAGASAEEQERRREAHIAVAQAAAAQPLVPAPTLPEIVDLTRNGTTDDIIIGQIRNSGAVYRLNSRDIMYLEQQGVRGPVIRELQDTVYRAPRRVIVPVESVYAAPPAVVGVYSRGW